MTVRVRDDFAEYVRRSSGAVVIELRDFDDPDAAVRALDAARAALSAIPHPEEPGDPLPSFVSDVETREGVAAFWFDVADAEAYDGLVDEVVRAIVTAVKGAGVDGTLSFPGELREEQELARDPLADSSPVLRALLRGVIEERYRFEPPPAELLDLVGDIPPDEGLDTERRRRIITWYLTVAVPPALEAVGAVAEATRLRQLPPLMTAPEAWVDAVSDLAVRIFERVRDSPNRGHLGILERSVAIGRSLDYCVVEAVGAIGGTGWAIGNALVDPAFQTQLAEQGLRRRDGAMWVASQWVAEGPKSAQVTTRTALVSTAAVVNELCRGLLVIRTVTSSPDQVLNDADVREREHQRCATVIGPIVEAQCDSALALLADLAAMA